MVEKVFNNHANRKYIYTFYAFKYYSLTIIIKLSDVI